jgi:hypothetical protein
VDRVGQRGEEITDCCPCGAVGGRQCLDTMGGEVCSLRPASSGERFSSCQS